MRRRHHLAEVGLVDAAILLIYVQAGTIPSIVVVAFAVSGALVGGILFAMSESGFNDRFSDHYLTVPIAVTTLALIIGFSFSFVSNRYDQRKTLEEAEANAIGTEYSRADLLPRADADKVKTLLRSYLDLRIEFYDRVDLDGQRRLAERTVRVHDELWKAVLGPAQASPTPVMALVVAGMNDVINSQSYTQAAWWNRMPLSSWAFLLAVALCCNFLIGYGLRGAQSEKRVLFIFPVLITIALTFIADIDAPRRGFIQVEPHNLKALADQLARS